MKPEFETVFKRWVPSDAGRPAGMKRKKDCTVRAVASFLGLTYQDARLLVCGPTGMPGGFPLESRNWRIADAAGRQSALLVFRRVDPRMRLHRALQELPETGRYILGMNRHVVAYVNGLLLDDHLNKPYALVNRIWELKYESDKVNV